MKKYFSILAIVALGITACNNKEGLDLNEKPEDLVSETQVYHFCIPATLDEGADTKAMNFDNSGATPTSTSTFSTSELVYVYNNSQSAWLNGTLQPTNLSNDYKSCDLSGALTGDINPGDELTLYYNANAYYPDPSYDFNEQHGSASSVIDGAKATVTVSDYTNPALTTTTAAHFSNLASMFRFKFKDENETPIEVHALTVCSKNRSLIGIYFPEDPYYQYYFSNIIMDISSHTADYLFTTLFFDESQSNASDALTFIAENSTHVFRGTRTAPSTGFKNGKYYYNTDAIQLTDMGAMQAPTIAWTNPSEAIEPHPSSHFYPIVSTTDNINIGLSGTSFGYRLLLSEYYTNTSTVSLNNLTAVKYEYPFIIGQANLIIDIAGTNSIDSRDIDAALQSNMSLRLQGNGTLTVTANLDETCGIFGGSDYNPMNNNFNTTTVLDVSAQLAADGYAVTRSARTNNADGTYTWTYTVAPVSPLAVKHLGDADFTPVTENITLVNGDILTGSLFTSTYPIKVSIAADATVTLSDVTINGVNNDSYQWAGLNCLGDATIVLADGSTNTVKGFYEFYPGIHIPNGYTLTIQGTGTLNTSSNGYGAGIGAGYSVNCGNIIIKNGTINASGGYYSAGIGGGCGYSCGTIEIQGGHITATSSMYSAGIGGGNNSPWGDITISGGVVDATGGNGAAGIGAGNVSWNNPNTTYGNISITGGTVTARGGVGGAGIGAGQGDSELEPVKSCNCGTITISGGTIDATGGSLSAGIGTGDWGNCGDITFRGGTITATCGTGGLAVVGKSNANSSTGDIIIDYTPSMPTPTITLNNPENDAHVDGSGPYYIDLIWFMNVSDGKTVDFPDRSGIQNETTEVGGFYSEDDDYHYTFGCPVNARQFIFKSNTP